MIGIGLIAIADREWKQIADRLTEHEFPPDATALQRTCVNKRGIAPPADASCGPVRYRYPSFMRFLVANQPGTAGMKLLTSWFASTAATATRWRSRPR